MQNVIQDFTIGFFDSSGVFSIYAKQRDVGRVVKFHIYDSLSEEDYTELLSDPDLLITVRVQLPSGTNLPDIEVDKNNVDVENLSVSVPLTAEMLQQNGVALCELVFASTDADVQTLISTTHFKLIISESFDYPQDSTREYFETWTELYIALTELEAHVEDTEAIRVSNENTRIDNENARLANEDTRLSNEATRESNEATRVTNEANRIVAENARDNAEQARDTAEQARDAAEQIRESKVQEQVDEAHMWANGMNSSTAPEDTPSATNNAKAWCERAHQIYESVFNGTVAEWNALSTEDKAKFVTVILLDD